LDIRRPLEHKREIRNKGESKEEAWVIAKNPKRWGRMIPWGRGQPIVDPLAKVERKGWPAGGGVYDPY